MSQKINFLLVLLLAIYTESDKTVELSDTVNLVQFEPEIIETDSTHLLSSRILKDIIQKNNNIIENLNLQKKQNLLINPLESHLSVLNNNNVHKPIYSTVISHNKYNFLYIFNNTLNFRYVFFSSPTAKSPSSDINDFSSTPFINFAKKTSKKIDLNENLAKKNCK
jgi:hypothetical protein